MEVLKIIQTSVSNQMLIQLPDRFVARKLEILVLPADDDSNAWEHQSIKTLNSAYSEDEPEYTLLMVKEPNF